MAEIKGSVVSVHEHMSWSRQCKWWTLTFYDPSSLVLFMTLLSLILISKQHTTREFRQTINMQLYSAVIQLCTRDKHIMLLF